MKVSQVGESCITALWYVLTLPLPVQINLLMTALGFWGFCGLFFTIPSPVAKGIFGVYFLQRGWFFWAVLWHGAAWTQWTSTIASTTGAAIALYVLYVNPIIELRFRSEGKES